MTPVPIVRCWLDGPEEAGVARLRFIPLGEFELWRYLMETRHGRRVSVDLVSVWVPEEAVRWNSGYKEDALEPVLRVRLDQPGPHGVCRSTERFFPAETYPKAQEALLTHYPGRFVGVTATPGYVLPASNVSQEPLAARA